MNNFYKILIIIIALGTVGASVGGTLYHFDKHKVDKNQYKEDQRQCEEQYEKDWQRYEEYVAFTDIRFLEQHRRDLQEHTRWMERSYPNRYRQMPEYQRLIEQIKQVTVKINAFYNRGR